jgi:hypothetical protein
MIQPRYMQALPRHVAKVEWVNITQEWLHLRPPGAAEPIDVAPHAPMQIAKADLAAHPDLEAWIEGLEIAGSLGRVLDPREVRADGAHLTWENISDHSLKLRLPRMRGEMDIEPQNMVSFAVADLERSPDWAARLDWLERRKLLRRVEG